MDTEVLGKEQRILRQVRKTLSNIVKDVTPLGGHSNPLTNSTIQEIMDCFDLISEREKVLAGKLGFDEAKPHYADGKQTDSSALNFVKLSKIRK
jgi:hypothetical protein